MMGCMLWPLHSARRACALVAHIACGDAYLGFLRAEASRHEGLPVSSSKRHGGDVRLVLIRRRAPGPDQAGATRWRAWRGTRARARWPRWAPAGACTAGRAYTARTGALLRPTSSSWRRTRRARGAAWFRHARMAHSGPAGSRCRDLHAHASTHASSCCSMLGLLLRRCGASYAASVALRTGGTRSASLAEGRRGTSV